MSVRCLLSTLSGIEDPVLLYKAERGRPRARHMLTEMDPTQKKLYDLFGLDAYAPAHIPTFQSHVRSPRGTTGTTSCLVAGGRGVTLSSISL